MTEILLVADAPWVITDARTAFDDSVFSIDVQDDPRRTVDAWKEQRHPVVLADLQVGSMGGMAVVRAVRDAAAAAGEAAPIMVLLLDRGVDSFLAGRSGADAWMQKPFGAMELRRTVESLLAARATAADEAAAE
jgi:DNA-binding response OmpR family regulator